MKAIWIEITGLDGSGKTTFKNELFNYLKKEQKKVHQFRMPYNDFVLPALNVSGNGKPLADNYTDQLIFALDYRLTNYKIIQWKKEYEVIISQRGIIDAYVHGVVRGFGYDQISELLKIKELEMPTIVIHMNANPTVAFNRIKNDINADKFETEEYINEQYLMTEKVYQDIIKSSEKLEFVQNAKHIYIDTTNITTEECFNNLIVQIEKIINND